MVTNRNAAKRTGAAAGGVSFQQTVLDNGLRVIGEHNPGAQSFAAGYFVKTGARDEDAEVSGVSHFLEHMMFKGTPRRSALDINLDFDRLGARYNAFTSDERTVYFGAVLPERGAELVELLSDMMRPALRQSDFDTEKQVILEEIAMYDDDPGFKVFEVGNARYFGKHPLGQSVLGSQESIQALTSAQMRAYFDARYAADNLFLAVAGNYDWETLLQQVEKLTHDWQPSGAGRTYPRLEPNTQTLSLPWPNLTRVHTALYAPGIAPTDPRRSAAQVLASCLGGSSGRLYWALLDNGLADSASLAHDVSDGLGTFIGYVSSSLEAQQDVLLRYRDVLEQVQQTGVSAEEWQAAQRKAATALTLRGETPFGRLMSLGARYQLLHDYQSVTDAVAEIMATPAEEGNVLLASRPFDALFSLSLVPQDG